MERYLSPRPWQASELFPGNVTDAGGDLVVECMHDDSTDENQAEANAHLIAAAPDLLDVAGSVAEFIEAALFGTVHDANAKHYVERLRKAIAKASE